MRIWKIVSSGNSAAAFSKHRLCHAPEVVGQGEQNATKFSNVLVWLFVCLVICLAVVVVWLLPELLWVALASSSSPPPLCKLLRGASRLHSWVLGCCRHANNPGGPPIIGRDGQGLHQWSPRGAVTLLISLCRRWNPARAEAGLEAEGLEEPPRARWRRGKEMASERLGGWERGDRNVRLRSWRIKERGKGKATVRCHLPAVQALGVRSSFSNPFGAKHQSQRVEYG